MNTSTAAAAPKTKKRKYGWVIWTDEGFLREQSRILPKQSWMAEHKKSAIAVIVLALLIGVLASVFSRLMMPFICSALIVVTFCLPSFIATQKNCKKFFKDMLKRGEIINKQNRALLENYVGVHWDILIFASIAIFYIYFAVLLILDMNGDNLGTSVYFSGLYMWFFIDSLAWLRCASKFSTPFVFLDLNEGALFGGAVFSYDILKGVVPSGKGGYGFDFYYEGKKVAYGSMLEDDMDYLTQMIEVCEKYGEAGNAALEEV
jgi:hypothetical protein